MTIFDDVTSVYIISFAITGLLVRSAWIRGWTWAAPAIPLGVLAAGLLLMSDNNLPPAERIAVATSVAGFGFLMLVIMAFIPPLYADDTGVYGAARRSDTIDDE